MRLFDKMNQWKKSQTSIIMEEIERQIDNGISDKAKIYDNIVLELGISRPVVRRCSAMLIKQMKKRVMILGDDSRLSEEVKKKILNINWNQKK